MQIISIDLIAIYLIPLFYACFVVRSKMDNIVFFMPSGPSLLEKSTSVLIMGEGRKSKKYQEINNEERYIRHMSLKEKSKRFISSALCIIFVYYFAKPDLAPFMIYSLSILIMLNISYVKQLKVSFALFFIAANILEINQISILFILLLMFYGFFLIERVHKINVKKYFYDDLSHKGLYEKENNKGFVNAILLFFVLFTISFFMTTTLIKSDDQNDFKELLKKYYQEILHTKVDDPIDHNAIKNILKQGASKRAEITKMIKEGDLSLDDNLKNKLSRYGELKKTLESIESHGHNLSDDVAQDISDEIFDMERTISKLEIIDDSELNQVLNDLSNVPVAQEQEKKIKDDAFSSYYEKIKAGLIIILILIIFYFLQRYFKKEDTLYHQRDGFDEAKEAKQLLKRLTDIKKMTYREALIKNYQEFHTLIESSRYLPLKAPPPYILFLENFSKNTKIYKDTEIVTDLFCYAFYEDKEVTKSDWIRYSKSMTNILRDIAI